MSKLRIIISVIIVCLFIVCSVMYFNHINKDTVEDKNEINNDYSDVTNVPIIDAKLGDDIKITQAYLKKYVIKKSSLWYMSNGKISSIKNNDYGTTYKVVSDNNKSLTLVTIKNNEGLKKGDKVNFVGTISLSDSTINLSRISKEKIDYSSPTIMELDELIDHINAIKNNYFIINGYMVTEGSTYKLYDNKDDYKNEEVQSIPFELKWKNEFNLTGNANVTVKCLIGSTFILKDCVLEK